MNLEEIRRLLAARSDPALPGPDAAFEPQQIAAAALLVECARIDTEFDPAEQAAIGRIVREKFGLDSATAETLIEVAERRSDEVWDHWLFTETIRTSFDEAEICEIVSRLWEVAYADGTLRRSEKRLVTRIARELGLSEDALDEAQARARARRPGRSGG